jgi:hypothetical protein
MKLSNATSADADYFIFFFIRLLTTWLHQLLFACGVVHAELRHYF